MNIEEIDTLPKFNLRGSIGPNVSDGILEMFGGSDNVSPQDLRDFLDENKDATAVAVEISSPGGYINEAVEMFDMLRASGKEIVTIGYRVNSAATVVMLAGDEGNRYAAENAEAVIHKAAIPPEALMNGPRLTDDELKKLAAEGSKENKRILDIYTKVLGKDKEQPLLALMSVETNLGAKGMMKYGFANKIYKPKKKMPLDNLKVRAFTVTPAFVNIIEQKRTSDMSKENSSIKKELDGFMARLEKLFKGKAFKGDVTLNTNDGKSITVVTEDETIQGKPAQIDGQPAPAGDYTLDDGRVITVDDTGNVTNVADAPAPPATDAVKKENEKLKAELKEANAKLAKVPDFEKENKELKAKVTSFEKLESEFAAFKKEITGDESEEKKKGQVKKFVDLTKDERKALTPTERLKIMQLEKLQAQK